MVKFAANLSMMFNEWEFMDRFKAAADAGFEAVEYLFPYAFTPDQIADCLVKNGLKQVLFNLPPGNWEAGERGLAALAGRKEEFQNSVQTALLYAQATKVPQLHVMSGHADRHDLTALKRYEDSIEYACSEANKHGVDILIEPINSRDMPGYFLNDFNFASDLIAKLGFPNLKLQYDIYHRQIIHGDVMKSLESMLPIIAHIQIASVPLRHEPCTGELDDLRLFHHLDAIGYTGFVGCEYRPANGTVAGLSWFQGL